ncbi:Phospholipase_D-nuclease N-terminal [Gracilibacillus ureilyticus]|uniref:Phospholipase_D-nuclease N-terminal n=1 Tax=Gracilibacillus ureilyticus TaxID=531814 RepID=A0A1H9QE54_9BACI|nr:PLD nuclease N-terminal domain-containing protein [Gracilibacillus ureilyticus]SER58159.1 Phospholipase_D-nuclease N-terminal [Gracilibacillus ureilyticus]
MDELQQLIDILPIIAPVIVIQLILMLVALVSLIRADDTNGPKWLWAILILFFSLIGPILYFIVGRRQS